MVRPVLSLFVVEVFSGFYLAVGVGAAVAWRATTPRSAEPTRVKARAEPARWAEAAWMGGAMVMVLWPLGVLAVPEYAYGWPTVPSFPFSEAIQLSGFALSLVGGLLFFTAARALGKHLRPTIQVEEGHRLVQEGPYQYIRHPVYTAAALVGFGLSILYLSPVLASIVLLLVGIAHYRARMEESLLSSEKAFGREYVGYMARTGRFLPRLRARQ